MPSSSQGVASTTASSTGSHAARLRTRRSSATACKHRSFVDAGQAHTVLETPGGLRGARCCWATSNARSVGATTASARANTHGAIWPKRTTSFNWRFRLREMLSRLAGAMMCKPDAEPVLRMDTGGSDWKGNEVHTMAVYGKVRMQLREELSHSKIARHKRGGSETRHRHATGVYQPRLTAVKLPTAAAPPLFRLRLSGVPSKRRLQA